MKTIPEIFGEIPEKPQKITHQKLKLGMTLAYFAEGIEAVADVATYGNAKYSTRFWEAGWRNFEPLREAYLDAAMRHIFSYLKGDVLDSESGRHQLAHAAWGLLAVLTHELKEGKKDEQS